MVNSPSRLQVGGPNIDQKEEEENGGLLTRITTGHMSKEEVFMQHPDQDITHWTDERADHGTGCA